MNMTTEMDLKGLIGALKGRRSYDDMERDCGGTPTSGRIHQLATDPQKNFPKPDIIAGLARGLGVTPAEVIMSAARSLGFRVSSGYDPEALVLAYAATLPDSARDALATLAREMHRLDQAAQQKEQTGDVDATPKTSAAGAAAKQDKIRAARAVTLPPETRTESTQQPGPNHEDEGRP